MTKVERKIVLNTIKEMCNGTPDYIIYKGVEMDWEDVICMAHIDIKDVKVSTTKCRVQIIKRSK